MLKRRTFLSISLLAASLAWASLTSSTLTQAASKDSRCFEIRVYYSPPGKLDDLHARFRDHTLKLFTKHGIENVGYWVPLDNKDNKLVYMLAYPNRAARDASWKAFFADPEWQAVAKKTEANGRIVAKVDQIFLEATDYSPAITTGDLSHGGVYEMRTYTTPPGLLPNLDARFRDHTLALFSKHGINNQGYFHKAAGQPEADQTLLYFLTHKSQDGAKESFKSFGQDPAWKAAREASEKKAGGSLTMQGGVKSEFLKATDYSPSK